MSLPSHTGLGPRAGGGRRQSSCPSRRGWVWLWGRSLAVDWMGDNLYWTDDGPKKTISVARLEKAAQTRKTLIEGKMTHPRAIVVDPLNG